MNALRELRPTTPSGIGVTPPSVVLQSTSFESHDDALVQQSLREAFDMYDRDGGGNLGLDEIVSLLTCLDLHITVAEADHVLKELDADAGGQLGFEEFRQLIARHKATREEEIKAAWAAYDPEGKGLVQLDDVKACLQKVGIHVFSEELEAIFDAADVNRSGTVDFDGFHKAAEPPSPSLHFLARAACSKTHVSSASLP